MDPSEAERRRNDRRHSDRRAAQGRRSQDGGDSGHSYFDPGWLASGDLPQDGRRVERRAHTVARVQDNALVRVYRSYSAARAAVGVGLVILHGVSSLSGTQATEWLTLVSLAYAAQAITLWLLPRFGPMAQSLPLVQQRRRQWFATVGVDLLAFSLLHHMEAGVSLNYAALLVLPVLMAGVLTSRLLALGTAAGVALVLLAAAWRASGGLQAPTLMLQSGLLGLGMFMITLLAGELASRLAREELAARGSLELARQQAQLNRLVIEEMADGVLVVDRRLLVRAANPAARALLVNEGLASTAPFMLDQDPAWLPLLLAAEQALADGHWPDAGRDVALKFEQGHVRTLRLRVRFMRRAFAHRAAHRAGEDPTADTADFNSQPVAVLLLEDVRTLQARIRQEKLAAMGRVSAGIAHEIRNPLAAISQANALMMEDDLAPAQMRLANMVADNVERLKQLVDDVMEVAPGVEPQVRVVDASDLVGKAASEWVRTMQLPMGPDGRLQAQISAEPLGVVFDPEHLRRVLVNLLDNAHRHALPGADAVQVQLAAQDATWVMLRVRSDGPLIAPDVERRLFEPFFSTRSRGSGLGLYICRELCERYGANIEYRPAAAKERFRNEFVVSMRRSELLAQVPELPLAPN